VAIADTKNEQTEQLLDHIKAENFEVEVTESFDRDVSEDSDVGAYIALVDGDRLEQARTFARSVRDIGFQTPLSFNRFPGFNYEVQGVFQERINGQIKFHTYVVRE
jgi:hypothetical protein